MTIKEAVKEAKKQQKAKFIESIELHLKTKPPKEGKRDFKFLLTLPHQKGDILAIVVLTSKPAAAKKAGAKYAGGEELVKKIEKGKIEFDVLLAEPEMMGLLKPLAKNLGRAGKMPNEKSGTLTKDIAKTIKEIMAGRREVKSDEQGGIHLAVGKTDSKEEEINANIQEVINAVKGQRGIEEIKISTTMSKAIPVDLLDNKS